MRGSVATTVCGLGASVLTNLNHWTIKWLGGSFMERVIGYVQLSVAATKVVGRCAPSAS